MLMLLAHTLLLPAQTTPVSLFAGVAHNASRTGPTAGLDIERPLGGPAAIRIGLGYVPRSLNDSAQTCTIAGVCVLDGVNVRTDFLAVTALVVVTASTPLSPYVAVGPYLAPRIGCSAVTVGDCSRVDTSDGGVVIEAGAILKSLAPAVGLFARYERALSATLQVPATDAGGSTDLHYQTISVALRIRLTSFGS